LTPEVDTCRKLVDIPDAFVAGDCGGIGVQLWVTTSTQTLR